MRKMKITFMWMNFCIPFCGIFKKLLSLS